MIAIEGSETQVETAPVWETENGKLWFPSLTNMMLAIAECLETLGTICPYFHLGLYADVRLLREMGEYDDMLRQKEEAVADIAKKYGSPCGSIVTF